jgi:hypothetical protein
MANNEPESKEYTLAKVIKVAMEATIADFRVCLPATVIKYSYEDGKPMCDAQPDFKRNYNGEHVQMPVIYNIPVMHPRAGDAYIHMPLKKGHKVLLFFCDKSLEQWLSNGKANNQDDTRAHHISDAFAYPGGYPFSDAMNVANGDDIIIKNGSDMEWRIKPNGHFQIFNASFEFMKLLTDIMTDLSESVVYTCGGPQQLKHARLRADMQRLRSFFEG